MLSTSQTFLWLEQKEDYHMLTTTLSTRGLRNLMFRPLIAGDWAELGKNQSNYFISKQFK
jgi:hypothetical protein